MLHTIDRHYNRVQNTIHLRKKWAGYLVVYTTAQEIAGTIHQMGYTTKILDKVCQRLSEMVCEVKNTPLGVECIFRHAV
jgi:predicted aconitase